MTNKLEDCNDFISERDVLEFLQRFFNHCIPLYLHILPVKSVTIEDQGGILDEDKLIIHDKQGERWSITCKKL